MVFQKVGNDAVMKMKKAFDEYDIAIPCPKSTLYFGIKGDATLSELTLYSTGEQKN